MAGKGQLVVELRSLFSDSRSWFAIEPNKPIFYDTYRHINQHSRSQQERGSDMYNCITTQESSEQRNSCISLSKQAFVPAVKILQRLHVGIVLRCRHARERFGVPADSEPKTQNLRTLEKVYMPNPVPLKASSVGEHLVD